LVMVKEHGNDDLYNVILERISTLLDHNLPTANPVSPKNLHEKPIASQLSIEVKMRVQRWWQWPMAWVGMIFKSILNYTFIERNLSVGKFSGHKYRSQIVRHADYQKFDDTLRMVLDCSPSQSQNICCYLEGLYSQGQIVYGVHISDSALMTCLMNDMQEGKHLHFVDGAEGGYAMAAVQLKGQLKK
jgi:hypothetical protein